MSFLKQRSLAAQMAMLLGVALLVAQLFNFALILNERQKLSLAQIEAPAINRFADVAGDLAQTAAGYQPLVIADASHRGARFRIDRASNVADAVRDPRLETRLRSALATTGIAPADVRAGITAAPVRNARQRARGRAVQVLQLSIRQRDGRWLNGRLLTPRRDPWLVARLGVATLLLYLIVLGATTWLALRLARPLRELTRAAERFGGREQPAHVASRGPADLRRAIEAFNAMNVRLLSLIDEKDRMLGAIGHDLRTPLASLRIRIETMEPKDEREAAIAKINETTALLEDILVLARSGRAREEAKPTDIAALVELLVDDERALGRDVTLAAANRVVAPVLARPLRRAIANLIDNAVAYGERARVEIVAMAGAVEIRIADDGPGVPADETERVLQPFYRLEGSRSRETGGSGLGLAIARDVAESHGGRLELRPGQPRGLVAVLVIPSQA